MSISENHVFALFVDHFTEYIFGPECFDFRYFKLYLSAFDENGASELSKEQKHCMFLSAAVKDV